MSGNISVSHIDWTIPGKKMIYLPEEEREQALKALQLNSGIPYSPDYNRLLAASSKKPTIKIRRALAL